VWWARAVALADVANERANADSLKIDESFCLRIIAPT
jgi:hypothetical protein